MSYSPRFDLHMPHWPQPACQEPAGTPSQRTRELLKKLGRPELKLPPVVHVGGTKGKGSTIAFLRAMLEAADYKVHACTSPHIDRFNERITLAGRAINDAELYEILERTRLAAGDMAVGFFDATTAASVLAFAEHPADILLLEMGLGGTVDATNIIDNPLLTILTTISYDHMEYMGDTLESIAAFEAGIMKPGAPCVISYQHPEAQAVIDQKAAEMNVALYAYGRHWLTQRTGEGMKFKDTHAEARLPMPSLLGAHQIVNAGNAIAAISLMEHFEVKPEHIIRGLMQAEWKGRLQRIPATLTSGSELWFDGGHNTAAAQVIALFVHDYWQDKPFYMIFGTSIGKDVVSMLAPFVNITKRIYGVPTKSEPSGYNGDEIARIARPITNVIPCDSISDALQDIMNHEDNPFRVLVFGSLYLWLETNDRHTCNQS